MTNLLEEFHHRIDRSIAGKTARRVGEEGWEYPPVEEALEAAGLWPMQEYVWSHQATIAYCISTHMIYELCNGVDKM